MLVESVSEKTVRHETEKEYGAGDPEKDLLFSRIPSADHQTEGSIIVMTAEIPTHKITQFSAMISRKIMTSIFCARVYFLRITEKTFDETRITARKCVRECCRTELRNLDRSRTAFRLRV